MKSPLKYIVLAAGAAGGMALTSTQAANSNFTAGDVIMYFQQFGGNQTVMVDLGTGISFRDATSSHLNLVDLGSTLSTTFGVNWFDDSTLYFGIAGVRSNSSGTSSQVNGDPNRTLYVSQARTGVGTLGLANSAGWSGFGDTDMSTGANGIVAMQGVYQTSFTSLIAVSPTSQSKVDDQNPFLGSNPGTAYGIFPGGVEAEFGSGSFGTLGGVNAEAALDLYRILATTAPVGTVAGDQYTGDYKGSFVIDNTGKVSYVQAVPEPSSAILLGSTLLLGGFVRRRKAIV